MNADLNSLDQDWSNYWKGRTAATSGTALVGVEKSQQINDFWTENLEEFSKETPALDLCCGAGTVAKILSSLGFKQLTGADISSAAIDIVTKDIPNIEGVVTPADNMVFDNGRFGLVVSQYGFEYGDYKKVIPEICRILRPGGTFLALSHHTEGAIHKEVSEQIAEMNKIKQSGFVQASRELFQSAMTGKTKKSGTEISQNFRQAQLKLFPVAQKHRGLAEYLYMNTQKMYGSHGNYEFSEIMKWFDGIENDIERFLGRMTSMHSSAIDKTKLNKMIDVFRKNGIKAEKPALLNDETGAVLGWVIKGQKA